MKKLAIITAKRPVLSVPILSLVNYMILTDNQHKPILTVIYHCKKFSLKKKTIKAFKRRRDRVNHTILLAKLFYFAFAIGKDKLLCICAVSPSANFPSEFPLWATIIYAVCKRDSVSPERRWVF